MGPIWIVYLRLKFLVSALLQRGGTSRVDSILNSLRIYIYLNSILNILFNIQFNNFYNFIQIFFYLYLNFKFLNYIYILWRSKV